MSVPNIKEARTTVVVGQRLAETASSPPRKAEDGRPVEARTVTAVERDRIVKRLQELARESGRALEFRVDESSERMVIVVRDQDTGEMIRQIPDATALRIAQRLESQVEALRSVLFEGRV